MARVEQQMKATDPQVIDRYTSFMNDQDDRTWSGIFSKMSGDPTNSLQPCRWTDPRTPTWLRGLFVPPERQPDVRNSLTRLIEVPFAFEHAGSQIIFSDREPDYAAAEHARVGRHLDAFTELERPVPASTPARGSEAP